MKHLPELLFTACLILALLVGKATEPFFSVTDRDHKNSLCPAHLQHGGEKFAWGTLPSSIQTTTGVETISCDDPHPDYDALIAMYDATGGVDWAVQTGWAEGKMGTSCDPCSFNGAPWYGLACNEAGRVVCIDFDNSFDCLEVNYGGSPPNTLTGELPDAFFSLSELKHISFRDNELSGPISPLISQLQKLEVLRLRNNNLNGVIPPELGDLPNLYHLSIGFNPFSSQNLPPELGQLTNLRFFSTDLVRFNGGGIPESYRNLTNLESFNITGGFVGGDIPAWLDEWTNIKLLFLGGNQFGGQIPDVIYGMTSLERIDLHFNGLTGGISSDLANLTNLVSFSAWSNGLSGPIPDVFTNTPNLAFLTLDRNQLTGPVPPSLATAPRIQTVNLRNNQLTGPLPEGFANPDNFLQFLVLNDNRINGCYPADFAEMCGDVTVRTLNNPDLPYSGDYDLWCTNGQVSIGAPCGDGSGNNVIQDDCSCSEQTILHCTDGVLNADETGVDCGGADCPVCPSCDDGAQNGDETGVDCGGSQCSPCITCNDGLQNGDETGVDCGGSCLPCSICDNAQSTPLVVDPRGRVASLQISRADYDSWIANDDFSDFAPRRELVGRLYCQFSDEFDFIFFILNEDSRPGTIPYVGKYIPIQNDVRGIGNGLFDNSGAYGSAGRLQGIIHLPARQLLRSGPSLHEIMHRWGNFGITTHNVSSPGTDISSFPFVPHWGFTGGSSKGQLGGFQQSSLEELGNNQYRVGSFGPFANGGNSVPYTELERYLAGFLAIEDVEDFDVFTDITSLDVSAGSTFTFSASDRTTYTSDALSSLLGARIPNVMNSQKDFRLLTVVITAEPLSQAEWNEVDAQSAWFGLAADDGTSLYNFWEATQGVGRMQTDGLQQALPVVLVGFNASIRGKTSLLTWETSEEIDNRGFHVQRLNHNSEFQNIGWVSGHSSERSTAYNFIDNAPLVGENIYRLLQEDFDGTQTPSPIRSVNHPDIEATIRISPNPSPGFVWITTYDSQAADRVTVYSMKGTLLRTFTNSVKIDLTDLPSALYILRIQDEGQTVTKRLLLKKS